MTLALIPGRIERVERAAKSSYDMGRYASAKGIRESRNGVYAFLGVSIIFATGSVIAAYCGEKAKPFVVVFGAFSLFSFGAAISEGKKLARRIEEVRISCFEEGLLEGSFITPS